MTRLSLVKLEDRTHPSVVFFSPPEFVGRLHYNPVTHRVVLLLGDVAPGEHHRVDKFRLTYQSNFLRGEGFGFGLTDAVVTLTGSVIGHTIDVSKITLGYPH